MIDFLAEALKYAKAGFAVFPCAEGGKVPAISVEKGGHGVKDATKDETQIRAWAKKYPHANIGLACGEHSHHIVCVDVDPRHGGFRSLAGLALKSRTFPDGPCSRTGNGGKHLFFHYDGKLSNGKNVLGSGIDIRAEGGYVIAPPSWIKPSKSGSGGEYAWIISPFDVKIPRLPIWMMEMLRPRPIPPFVPPKTFMEATTRVQGIAEYAARAPEGLRNKSTFWAACRMAELVACGKVHKSVATAHLRMASQSTGLTMREIDEVINRVIEKNKRRS